MDSIETFARDFSGLIRVDLGTVVMRPEDRAFIWGAVQERIAYANTHGEYYAWPDFVRDALLEAANR